MFSHNGKISTRQVTILLILQMFNMNMLIMPRVSTNYLGRNGYVASILAILLGLVYVFFITSLTTSFPGLTFVEIVNSILPNWIANVLVLLLSIKLILSAGLELRLFGEMIAQIMLPKTPMSVIMIALILTAGYLVKSGAEATARMGELLILFIAVPLVIALLALIFNLSYGDLLPFFRVEPMEVAVGTVLTSVMFVPLEILLMLNGLMKDPSKSKLAGKSAVITIGLVQGLITLLCVAQNGLDETQSQIWPAIVLMKSIGVSNATVENQEALMLIVWIFSVYMYVSISLYMITLIGSRNCKFKRENIFVWPVIPIILFVALYPNDLGVVYNYYLKFEYYFGLCFIVPIPFILLLIAKIRGVGND